MNAQGLRSVWLVRHGMRQDFVQPDWKASAARPHDTPLSKEGLEQARETGAFLADQGIEIIYASPFLRAVETAGVIAEVIGAPICIEPGLGEVQRADWFPGPLDFIAPDTLKARFPTIDLSYQAKVVPSYPESEEDGTMGARCRRATQALLEAPWRTSLWVGHGASVGGLAGALTGHVNDVCFRMCGLTGWRGQPGAWSVIYSGVDHLTYTEDHIQFHV